MTDKQIIIDGCNVSNCKYYIEDNGVEYQGLYQYTNMCYKLPYDNCENKRFCWHKIISKIKIFNLLQKISENEVENEK